MNAEFVVLRLLHIVAGAFWVGSALFLTLILEPSVRALGPAIQGPVMRKLGPKVGMAAGTASFITVGAGVALALRLRWNSLDTWFDTGWGYAILIGFIVSILGIVTGAMTGAQSMKMERIAKGITGRAPTPEETQQMKQLSERLAKFGRATAVLVTIGVGTMAAARFV
ncbi:MAG: hypothetical protein FJ317_00675 [SAR202 cluster bacterium]|nr:hypothetical protein [SAR202 cluster bacterium]